jgi:hypothetical protein
MNSIFKIISLFSIICFVGCSEEDPGPEKEELEIPQDKFAFYMFEGFNDRVDLHTITQDSIKGFVKCFVDYKDIISYDTSTFRYEITGVSKTNIDSVLFGFMWPKPVVAISEGRILFFADVRSGVASFFPDYFYLEPFPYGQNENGLLEFRFPPTGVSQADPDPRINPSMLEIFSSDGKLVE